ncbi:hypothetical protein V2W45_1333917 [Cenococcum geophilum]
MVAHSGFIGVSCAHLEGGPTASWIIEIDTGCRVGDIFKILLYPLWGHGQVKAQAGDYQPGLLTKDKENELQEPVDEKGQPMTLFDFAETYTEINSRVSLPTTLLGQFPDTKQYFKKLDHDRHQILKAVRTLGIPPQRSTMDSSKSNNAGIRSC